jgi:pyrophosphatase PpaX
MSPSQPLAVLFDLDGTLLDSIELILRSARNAFVGYDGRVPTDAEWLEGLGRPLADCMRPYAANDTHLEQLLDGYRTYQRAHHDRLVKCYDRVVGTIHDLRAAGHQLGVVTSKTHALTVQALALEGIDTTFDVIISLDSTTQHKPHPAPVLAALEALTRPASEAVFVGDSPYDVESGNSAGVTTVGALWGPFGRGPLERAGAHHLIERMADLPALLSNLRPRRGI